MNKRNQKARAAVIDRILNDDQFVYWLLNELYEQQEDDEQQQGQSFHTNRRGFTGWDAPLFSDFARHLREHGFLTDRQLKVCRKRTKDGVPRLGHYWEQALQFMQCWERDSERESEEIEGIGQLENIGEQR